MRNFFSTVQPNVHTKPSRKRRFSKTLSSNKKNMKTPALRFILDGKHFENEVFKDDGIRTKL